MGDPPSGGLPLRKKKAVFVRVVKKDFFEKTLDKWK